MSAVSVIIPTWNRVELLTSILTCVAQQTLQPEEVIVVDNGSSDGSEAVAREFDAQVIRFEENRGFASAVNAGVKRASGQWVLILNNDVLLPPDWLHTLLSATVSGNAAFGAGKLVRSDRPEILDGSWDLISRGAHAWRSGYGRKVGEAWSRQREVDLVPMTAALFRRSTFETVGFLDERFEAYYEDVDFGIRCALAGLRGIYEPAAVAQHMSKGTLGSKSARVLFLTARNQMFVLAKHYPAALLRRWFWPIAISQALSLGGAMRDRQFLAALRGLAAGLRQWSAMRGDFHAPSSIETVLTRNEKEIHSLQLEYGYDPYWRLYFRLVRSG